MNGARAQLVVVQEQILQVPDRRQSISRDAVNGVLVQMQQHQVAWQTLWNNSQVVIRQIQTLEASEPTAGNRRERNCLLTTLAHYVKHTERA